MYMNTTQLKTLPEPITDEQQFYRENGIIANPFPDSIIKQEMYHGSQNTFTVFERTAHGIWFAEYPDWCRHHYGNEIYVCWVNVRNPYYPTDQELDRYYGREDILPDFLSILEKEGYDAYIQGMESGSIAVLGNALIINAITGKPM